MARLSKRNINPFEIFSLIIVFAVTGVTVYLWQHNKVNNLAQQVSKTSSETIKLQNQNNKLTKDLNNSNQAVAKLTETDNFSSGAQCQTQQLTLSAEKNLGAAAGNRYFLFSYQNISQAPCTLNGYPGFLALDSTGHVVPNGPIKTNGSPTVNTLELNDKAYFLLHWSVATPSQCITASLLESTPPGNTYPLVLAINSFDVCGSYIDISPLAPLSQYSNYL